jgi:hypothetical protein
MENLYRQPLVSNMESPNGIEKAMKPVSCLESPNEIEKAMKPIS